MSMYNVSRFEEKQRVYFDIAFSEIQRGSKQSCWMWYVFPQLKSLGRSELAKLYGIADIEEAKAYIAEPYLRENLIKITRALLALDGSDPIAVMGYPDNLKLRSCMTLFEAAAPEIPEFAMVINKYFRGERDEITLRELKLV